MDEEKLRERQRLEDVVSDIDRDVDAAVVEGYLDRVALRRLGFSGSIFESAERTNEDLAEDLERAASRVAILTDFDEAGKEANLELTRELQGRVDVIAACRKDFGAELTYNGRIDVEDVMPLFESWEEKFVDASLDGLFFRR